MDEQNAATVAEKVRPLVNDILARFNTEQITPQEAGMVILALTHRLLGALDSQPAERQSFIMSLISVVNQYLSGRLAEEEPSQA
jgi:hypothetical protein